MFLNYFLKDLKTIPLHFHWQHTAELSLRLSSHTSFFELMSTSLHMISDIVDLLGRKQKEELTVSWHLERELVK